MELKIVFGLMFLLVTNEAIPMSRRRISTKMVSHHDNTQQSRGNFGKKCTYKHIEICVPICDGTNCFNFCRKERKLICSHK